MDWDDLPKDNAKPCRMCMTYLLEPVSRGSNVTYCPFCDRPHISSFLTEKEKDRLFRMYLNKYKRKK